MVQTYNPLLKKRTKKELEEIEAIIKAGEKAKKEKELPKIKIPEPKKKEEEKKPAPFDYDIGTLAGRLAAAGVPPYQPGMSAELSAELRGLYKKEIASKKELELKKIEEEKKKSLIAKELGAEQQELIFQEELEATLKEPKLSPVELATTAGAGIVAGTVGGFAGAALGAKAGALIGTAAAPGIGTVAGAVIGALVGGGGAIITKISLEKRQDVKEANAVFIDAVANMEKIKGWAKEGLFSGTELRIMQDTELINFYAAERNIKILTQSELNEFLGDGRDEASGIEAFKRRINSGAIEREFEAAILEGQIKKAKLRAGL